MEITLKVLKWCAVLSLFLTACTKKNENNRSKASYAIGVQMAENFRQQNFDLDVQAFQRGIDDGYNQKSRYTPAELQESLVTMQQEASKKLIEESAANKKKADDFLEKNKAVRGVKVTKSGLQYLIEKEGTGDHPKAKDVVKFHFRGSVADGEQFDSSYDRGQPATIPVIGTIPAWTEAFQLMKVGEKIKLFVPPELGYGMGVRPHIPPNSALVYELELLGIEKTKN
jgi:FKBP-type peptidyl-prolyl cis-trans isomerase FkpA/FKBP-type peptidyl-prolyl cis-trans isomerase FklB